MISLIITFTFLQNNRSDKPSMSLQLMGGHIESLESKMIGVDDQVSFIKIVL